MIRPLTRFITLALAIFLMSACPPPGSTGDGDDAPPNGGGEEHDAGSSAPHDGGGEEHDAGASAPHDGGGEEHDAGASDAGGDGDGAMCPPSGPFGNTVGDTMPDVELMDCDGNLHSTHTDICTADAAWVFTFAYW